MIGTDGAWLGIDVGTVRIGVALAPAGTTFAAPLCTVAAGAGAVSELAGLIRERHVTTVIVGDPISMSGAVGPAARKARAFARELSDEVPAAAVRMLDERWSTTQSQRLLREAGRNTRGARTVVDQAAAVVILQNALDTTAATGVTAGWAVHREE